MNKEEYTELEMETLVFEGSDVITASCPTEIEGI